jgi:hypothetical protein
MRSVNLLSGLGHRLLVAAARAHYAAADPCDWDELARATGTTASPDAINRALAHLADDGLVEAVHTPSGWLNVCVTAQGLRRAGRAGRQIAPVPAIAMLSPAAATALGSPALADGEQAGADALDDQPGMHPLLQPTLDTVTRWSSVAARTTEATLRRGGERTRGVLTPRVAAFRTSVAEAWHVFTTFP